MKLVARNTHTKQEFPVIDWPTAMLWLHSQPEAHRTRVLVERKDPPEVGRVGRLLVNARCAFIVFAYYAHTDSDLRLRFSSDQTIIDRLWNGDPTC